MSVAFLFPGQGAQTEGLLHHLPEHAAVTRTLAEADAVLGLKLGDLDTAEAQRSTVAVQMQMLVAGVATARALLAEGVDPSAVAGMSVGAFGAAVICGTLDFADALPLVRLRGELMQAAFPGGYGMAAIIGLDDRRVEALVEDVRTQERPVYVANLNAPRQIVLAGSDEALAAVVDLALVQGAQRAKRLEVSVPSHCPLLEPVADRLLQAMAPLPLRPPTIPFVSNRGGRALYDVDSIREDLATNVSHPVRWFDSLEVLRELGTTLFLEMPPGHVSTRIVTQFLTGPRAISIAERGLRSATVAAARDDGADFQSSVL
jgi:malonate decarboxylase epsilon subunit